MKLANLSPILYCCPRNGVLKVSFDGVLVKNIIASLLLLLFVPLVTQASPNFLVVDPPEGVEATNFFPHAVSADGTTVVGEYLTFEYDPDYGGYVGRTRAFSWTAATGTRSLGEIPGGLNSIAHDVSGDGSVIVGEADFQTPDHGPLIRFAVRWVDEGPIEVLDTTSLPGDFANIAYRVNLDGTVIVGENVGDDGGGLSLSRPFLHTKDDDENDVFQLLPDGGFEYLRPDAISPDGTVVAGTLDYQNGPVKLFTWSQQMGLLVLPQSGWRSMRDMSSDGSIVVAEKWHWNGFTWVPRGYSWTEDEGYLQLPLDSIAALTADGKTAVGATANGAAHSLWNEDLGVVELIVLFQQLGIDMSDWTWWGGAKDISADGSVIVGFGTF